MLNRQSEFAPIIHKDPTDLWKILYDGGKFLWNLFFNKKKETSEKISKQSAILDGQETIDEIMVTNNIFQEFLTDLNKDIEVIENQLLTEVSYFFEEFLEYVKDECESFDKYGINIRKVEKDFLKIKRRLNGQLKKKIYQAISLDNLECREILSLRAGNKKKERMDVFIDSIFQRCLDELIYEIKEELLDLVEEMEMILEDALDVISQSLKQKITACMYLEQSNECHINKKQIVISEAILKKKLVDEIVYHYVEEGGL